MKQVTFYQALATIANKVFSTTDSLTVTVSPSKKMVINANHFSSALSWFHSNVDNLDNTFFDLVPATKDQLLRDHSNETASEYNIADRESNVFGVINPYCSEPFVIFSYNNPIKGAFGDLSYRRVFEKSGASVAEHGSEKRYRITDYQGFIQFMYRVIYSYKTHYKKLEVAEPEAETSDTKQSVSNLSKDTPSDWLNTPHQIVGSSVYTTGDATLRILGLL